MGCLTRSTASRAARASISAHETTPGHTASSWDLASSITSNPLSPKFCGAVRSEDAPEIKTDASHPCNAKSAEQLSDSN